MLKSMFIRISVIFIMGLVCASCNGSRVSDTFDDKPFVFRSLNLKHSKSNGDNDWDLVSPEARYDIQQRIIRAKNPTITVYHSNIPSLEIESSIATIINDGEMIVLQGDVQFKRIEDPRFTIQVSDTLWNLVDGPIISNEPIYAFSDTASDTSQQKLFANNLRGDSRAGYVEFRACKIIQSKDNLTADICKWDWLNNKIYAFGNVIYNRSSPRQLTTSEQMDIDIGSNGRIVFSSPNSQVNTKLLLPINSTK